MHDSGKMGTSHRKTHGHYAGHTAEPAGAHGHRSGGKQPAFHSHSKRHHRSLSAKSQIKGGGRKR